VIHGLQKLLYSGLLILLCISCASDDALYYKNAAVAVWDFDNLSPATSVQNNLGELLSSQVIEVLQEKGEHPIVERERLKSFSLELHHLSMSQPAWN
jgi:hypothetical protein